MKKNTKHLHHNHRGNTSFVVIAIVLIVTLTAILLYAYHGSISSAVGNVVRQVSANPTPTAPTNDLEISLKTTTVSLPFSEGVRPTSALSIQSTDKIVAKNRVSGRNIPTDHVYITQPNNEVLYIFAQKNGEQAVYIGSVPYTSSGEQEVIAWTGGRNHNKIQFTYKNVGPDRALINVLSYPDQSNIDDIHTYWRTTSANPFSALGAYASRIEADEIKIDDKYVGDASQDMATNYGGLVENPSTQAGKDVVMIRIPADSVALH